MSKELIDRIRELQAKDWASPNEAEAADALEAQQKRIDELESEIDRKMSAASYVIEQLAAAQAQIKVMREALNAAKYATKPSITLELIEAALAQPTDNSALRELLKAERERCAQLCDSIADADPYETNGYGCAAKIRAMEDQ